MRSQRFLIPIGVTVAWLYVALGIAPAHFSLSGNDARHLPSGPQPVWVEIDRSFLTANEQRKGGGGDDGPIGTIWSNDANDCTLRCSPLVCGQLDADHSYLTRVIGARSPPM